MDVQGFECQILREALRLAISKVLILMEVCATEINEKFPVRDLKILLTKNKYFRKFKLWH